MRLFWEWWLVCWNTYYSADGRFEVSFKSNVLINYDGSILWVPCSIYKSSCTMDVKYFPFDEQRCSMSYGSWTYNGNEVRVLPYVTGFTKVSHRQCQCQYQKHFIGGAVMSRVWIGGAGDRRKCLTIVICSRAQFSVHMCLGSGDGSGTFRHWRQRVPDSWWRDNHDNECFGLKLSPADRVVVDWRNSE